MNPKKFAQNILISIRENFIRDHDLQKVDGRTFSHLDLNFYQSNQNGLSDLGFQVLGDVEDKTMALLKFNPRTFIRVMISQDQKTVVAFYHIKPVLWIRIGMWISGMRQTKIIEFESYDLDDTHYVTSTAPEYAQIDHPESIKKNSAVDNMSLNDLYQSHIEFLKKNQAEDLNTIKDLDQIIKIQNLQFKMIYDHLEKIGWVSLDYLYHQLGKNQELANDVYINAQRLVKGQLATLTIETPSQNQQPKIYNGPSQEEIDDVLRQTDWQEDTTARIDVDENNFITVGRKSAHTFEAFCAINKKIDVTQDDIKSIDEVVAIMQSFAIFDFSFKKNYTWNKIGKANQVDFFHAFQTIFLSIVNTITLLSNSLLSFFTDRMRVGNTINVKDDDPEMLTAISEAKASLKDFLRSLKNPSGDCRNFTVKLKIEDQGKVEHFWMKDLSYDGNQIKGILDNEPQFISSVKAGDKIDINPEDITDWGYFKNNHGVGFFTTRVLLKSLGKKEKDAIKSQFGWE